MNNCVVTCAGIQRHLVKRTSSERGGTVAGHVGHSWTSSLEPAL